MFTTQIQHFVQLRRASTLSPGAYHQLSHTSSTSRKCAYWRYGLRLMHNLPATYQLCMDPDTCAFSLSVFFFLCYNDLISVFVLFKINNIFVFFSFKKITYLSHQSKISLFELFKIGDILVFSLLRQITYLSLYSKFCLFNN